VVVYLNNHATFIEGDIRKKFDEVMGNGLTPYMFQYYPHWGFVRETPLLLIKSKVCGMEVDNERGGLAAIFLQDIVAGYHCQTY
jgi:hypothetical protein